MRGQVPPQPGASHAVAQLQQVGTRRPELRDHALQAVAQPLERLGAQASVEHGAAGHAVERGAGRELTQHLGRLAREARAAPEQPRRVQVEDVHGLAAP